MLGDVGRALLWGQTRAPNLYPPLTGYGIWGKEFIFLSLSFFTCTENTIS